MVARVLDNKVPVAEMFLHRFWTRQKKYSDKRDGSLCSFCVREVP